MVTFLNESVGGDVPGMQVAAGGGGSSGKPGILGVMQLVAIMQSAQLAISRIKTKLSKGKALLLLLDEKPDTTTLAKDLSMAHVKVGTHAQTATPPDGFTYAATDAADVVPNALENRIAYREVRFGVAFGSYLRADLNEALAEVALFQGLLSEKLWGTLLKDLDESSQTMFAVLSGQLSGLSAGLSGSVATEAETF